MGVLARFVIKPRFAGEPERFLAAGLPIVETQPPTTRWFGFRVDEHEYGAFAVFASDVDRAALLAAGGPRLAPAFAEMFAEPPTFTEVDIVAHR